jgi:protein involved in polysaccharide export with SLBB domain
MLVMSPARGQGLPQQMAQQPSPAPAQGPSLQIDMGMPAETEVMQAGRPIINSERAFSLPLDAPLDPDKYMVGRGDVLELNFWGAQNYKLRVAVDMEGHTFVSKVGYIDILGKTLTEARAIMKKAVLRYLPGLNVEVVLLEPRTFLVHVVENVVRPGMYVAKAVDHVSTVLDRAGGRLPGASQRRIVIQRRDGTQVPVDLLLYSLTGDTRYNPQLRDGDVVRVPFEDLVATISGAVRRPGSFELINAKDFAELLDLAGGLGPTATRQLPIRLVRRDKDERLSQSDIAYPAGGMPNWPLQTNDQVSVPGSSELQRTVMLVGAIFGALLTDPATHVRRLSFVEGDTVRSLLERDGGVLAGADLAGASIVHQDGTQVPLDLETLIVRRDFSADKPVAMGDTVLIPFERRGVVVYGAVFRPEVYQFKPNFNVLDYVSAAGGPTRSAQELEEYRLINSQGKIVPFSADLKVKPGDTIVVPERNFTRPEIVQLAISAVGLVLSTTALVIAAHSLK